MEVDRETEQTQVQWAVRVAGTNRYLTDDGEYMLVNRERPIRLFGKQHYANAHIVQNRGRALSLQIVAVAVVLPKVV